MDFLNRLNYLKFKLGIGKILIAVISLHIVMILGNFFAVKNIVDNIEEDVALINSAGLIRGGMQRIVKLELSGVDIKTHIKDIEELFSFFLYNEKLKNHHLMKDFTHKLKELQHAWIVLKENLFLYEENPSLNNKEKLVKHSEIVWKLSKETLNLAQSLSEAKTNTVSMIFLIFFLDLILVICVIWFINKSIRLKLEVNSRIDSLTQIYNRSFYNEFIELEIKLAKELNSSFGFLIFDIDFFKKINDTLGHDKGDEILKNLSKLISSSIRKEDFFARIGGEEFVIIVKNISQKEFENFANNLRKLIEDYDFKIKHKVTASFGITMFNIEDTKESIFKRADEALYESKEKGRNKVTFI